MTGESVATRNYREHYAPLDGAEVLRRIDEVIVKCPHVRDEASWADGFADIAHIMARYDWLHKQSVQED